MVITQIIGNINDIQPDARVVDLLELEWYEASKKILHQKTLQGKEMSLKLLNSTERLSQGDILFEDSQGIVVISIKPCEAIIITPSTMREMAVICYEIGNKHLPLFYETDELIIPYEAPIFRTLQASGFNPRKEQRKLLNQLKTSVVAHSHTETKTLFSRILQLTSPNE